MLIKRSVLLAKLESMYNTDPTPVGSADAVLVENLSIGFANQRMADQAEVKNTIGTRKKLYGGTLMQVTFDVSIKGSGAAGTAPEISPLFQACGLGETIVASTSVTYAPVSSGLGSATIYAYLDGVLYKITGCRGNISANLETGAPAKLSFSLTGHFVSQTDAALATPTYDSTVPEVMVSAGFSIDSYSAVIQALAFDLGNEVSTPPDINASDGYGAVQITGRDVQGSFNPEAVLKATKDFITAWQSDSALALTTGVIGGTAGNKFQLSMDKVSYRDIGFGDRDGIRTYEIPFGAAEDTGDDEISIVFT